MLELQNITFEVEENGQTKRILSDVSLTIDERFVAITGPNGSGKSTLAKIIAGILTPTGGKLLFNGEDIHHASFRHRARKAGHLVCLPAARALQGHHGKRPHLARGGQAHHGGGGVRLSLRSGSLRARLYRPRSQRFSFGGRIKAHRDRDRPRPRHVSFRLRRTRSGHRSFDLWSFQNLISVFEKMYAKSQGSIVIISHQERILNIADKIVVLSAGRIERVGTREEILPSLLGTSACRALTDKLS